VGLVHHTVASSVGHTLAKGRWMEANSVGIPPVPKIGRDQW
jgi:hypothetical protein